MPRIMKVKVLTGHQSNHSGRSCISVPIIERAGTLAGKKGPVKKQKVCDLQPSSAKSIAEAIIERISSDEDSIFGSIGQELVDNRTPSINPRYFRLKKSASEKHIISFCGRYFDSSKNKYRLAYEASIYDEWQCLPLLEGLYENDPTSFYRIIDALNQKGVSEEKRREFLTCLQELPSSISTDFLTMKDKESNALLKQAIEELDTYVKGRKQDEKSKAATALVTDLSQSYDLLIQKAEGNTSETQRALTTLKHKLVMKRCIKEKEPILNKHQGYKRLLTNIMTALFGFIPNAINYCVTGSFLFFDKTDSEKKAESIDRALTVAPKTFS